MYPMYITGPVVSLGFGCYYLDGRVAKVTDFLKTRLLDTLSDQIRKIQKVRLQPHFPQSRSRVCVRCCCKVGIPGQLGRFMVSWPANEVCHLEVVNSHVPGKRIWLEGIGATSEGVTTNLSDSYAASFLWLNSLGMLASQGIDVVMRHSFFDHGHNHLVDQNFNPLPPSAAERSHGINHCLGLAAHQLVMSLGWVPSKSIVLLLSMALKIQLRRNESPHPRYALLKQML
ncbi:UNVERIFIED_CONTAM: hypothetical protein K2H54_049772 [Gekko kuhli]